MYSFIVKLEGLLEMEKLAKDRFLRKENRQGKGTRFDKSAIC